MLCLQLLVNVFPTQLGAGGLELCRFEGKSLLVVCLHSFSEN